MSDPTNFAERIAALEARISDLQLGDLPLAALQRKLENDWQPDAAVLLQPNSITSDQLASGAALLSNSSGVTRTVKFLKLTGIGYPAVGAGPNYAWALTVNDNFGGATPIFAVAHINGGSLPVFQNMSTTDSYGVNTFRAVFTNPGGAFAAGTTNLYALVVY